MCVPIGGCARRSGAAFCTYRAARLGDMEPFSALLIPYTCRSGEETLQHAEEQNTCIRPSTSSRAFTSSGSRVHAAHRVDEAFGRVSLRALEALLRLLDCIASSSVVLRA